MADVTAQARIEAPAEKIWGCLTDFDGYDQWNATHTSFPEGGPETLAPGATYAENMKLMGFPAEVTWTVRAAEPARLLDLRGKGPMGVTLGMRYALVPESEATTGERAGATTVRIDGSFTGAAVSLMAGKLKDSATSALEESLGRLARLVG